MAEVVNTVVQAVAPRTVTRRSDGQAITLWEVTDGNGVVWVARKDVATIAQQMLGQTVTMVRRLEQKGEYTNRYLDAIEFNGAPPMPQMNPMPQANPIPPYVAQAQQAQASQPTAAQLAPIPVVPGGLSEKDKQIHRQVAAKVAATLQGNNDQVLDFWANCEALARYFDTGQTPVFMEPAVTTPPYVQHDAPPPPGDDDIPF